MSNVTAEYARSAACQRIIEFDMAQLSSIWYVNLAFENRHIDAFAPKEFENAFI